MQYFAFIEDNAINGKGNCRCLNEEITNIEITEEVYNDLEHYKWDGENVVLNENYEEEQIQKRKDEFNADFFNTSLGYVRRRVTMANGGTKDFLSDLLPVISMGLQSGVAVTVLTYDLPDFTKEEIDWEALQHTNTVTATFIQECMQQLSADFMG